MEKWDDLFSICNSLKYFNTLQLQLTVGKSGFKIKKAKVEKCILVDENYWRYPFRVTVEERDRWRYSLISEAFRSDTIIGHTPGETTCVASKEQLNGMR